MTIWDASPVFDDTFTEGSDTTLASHTPDTGVDWTAHLRVFTVIAASDKLSDNDSTGFGIAESNVSGGISDDMAVQLDMDNNDNFTGVLGRLTYNSDTGPDWDGYAAFWRDGEVELYERTDTSFTLLDNATVTFTPGDTLRLECDGTSISAWTDTGGGFVQRASATDSTHTSGGAGIRGNSSEGSPWADNYQVYEKTVAAAAPAGSVNFIGV